MMSTERSSSVVSETSRYSVTFVPSDSSCNRHQYRPLIVFCQECEVALCDSCLSSGDHLHHTYLSLPEACKKLMETLIKKSKDLMKNMKKASNFTSDTSSRKRLGSIEENFLQSKEHIETLYNELKNMLEANKKQALKLLNAQQDVMMEKLSEIKQNGENIQDVIADIREKLDYLREQNPDSVSSVLKEVLEQEIRIKTLEKAFVNQQEDPKFDDLRLKSLENSVHAILQKTKACLPYPWEFAEFITFDQNMAHKKLTVSDDKKQVFAKDLSRAYQLNASLNTQLLPVRAEQSFTTGQHYWEVDVRGCQSWMVGLVAEEAEPGRQAETFQWGHNRQSWMLVSDSGVLSVLHNDDMTPVREQGLSFLGVFIDCEKGRLRFYNVAANASMAIFAFQRGRRMWPVFYIIPDEGDFSCLVLCDICEEPGSEGPAIMADSSVSSANDPAPNSHPRSASPAIMADSSVSSPNDPAPNSQ